MKWACCAASCQMAWRCRRSSARKEAGGRSSDMMQGRNGRGKELNTPDTRTGGTSERGRILKA
eukprot:272319-Alexandrium_andersonii.AAC.1